MAKGQGRTGLIVTIIVLAVTLLVVGGLAVWQGSSRSTTDDSSSDQSSNSDDSSNDNTNDDTPVTPDEPTTPTVDPSTLTSVDIEPMKLVVYYSKGTPGFDFVIERTAEGTQYVQFSAAALKGTKCTDDEGVFASIIKSPTSTEGATTISQTTVVGGTTYGLSLSGANCTSNTTLLDQYQTAFKNGFSSLKAME